MRHTNIYNLPDGIVQSLTRDTYEQVGKFSATGLGKSPRQRLLEIRHDDEIVVDVSENSWLLLGRSVHGVIELQESINDFTEERLTMEVGGVVVSGQSDVYEGHETISDYKVTSVFSFMLDDQPKEEWVRQLNVYKALWENAGFTVKRLRIVAILRDWMGSRAGSVRDFDTGMLKNVKPEPGYPLCPIHIVDIPMWTNEECMEYIEERVALHLEAEDLPDEELPHCTKKEMWVRDESWAIKKEGNKRATKVEYSPEDAEAFLAEKTANAKKGEKFFIEHRPGVPTKCIRYCHAMPFCKQFQEGWRPKLEI